MSLWKRAFGPGNGAASVANQTPLNQQAALAGPLPAKQLFVATAEAVILNPENLLTALIASIPPNTNEEQSLLDLVATGYIQTTSSSNITLKLYSGTSTTPGSNTLLGSSGALAQNTAIEPFALHAQVIYDSVSGKLRGQIEFLIAGVRVATVALSNVVTGLNNVNNPVANFLLSFQTSGAAPGTITTINVQNFSVG